jgi:hypothetical protein
MIYRYLETQSKTTAQFSHFAQTNNRSESLHHMIRYYVKNLPNLYYFEHCKVIEISCMISRENLQPLQGFTIRITKPLVR